MLDSDLSQKANVSQLTARCYSCLRRIKSCRRALTRITSVTVVNSLIDTKLDYYNSLLTGCTRQTPDKLQRVLNCSARVILCGDSRHHVTPLLRDHMHWLREMERISFKVCILMYKAIHGLTPWYLNEMCIPVSTVPNLSALRPLLVVIWPYPEQGYNSATGHFVWLVRSPGTVYHWTFVRHLHY